MLFMCCLFSSSFEQQNLGKFLREFFSLSLTFFYRLNAIVNEMTVTFMKAFIPIILRQF